MKTKLFFTLSSRILAGFSLAITVLCCFQTAQAQAPVTYNVLDSFSFLDTNYWTDDYTVPALGYTNIVALPGPDGNAMLLDTTNLIPAYLNYPVFDDGWTNIQFNIGTILLWFSPASWSSTNGGAGPGEWGRLIEAGSYTTNASYGWWSIYMDPDGDTIYFSGQTNNGGEATYLSYPIAWATNAWHSVVLAYSSTNSTLFLDGITVTNGLGVSYYPGSNVLNNGFWIGSDSNGTNQARGLFSGVLALDTPVNSNIVAGLIVAPSMGYDLGNPLALITSAPSDPSTAPVSPDVITGGGNLITNGTATNCVEGTNGYNAWITNVTTTKVSGTNLTMDVTFTIEGGSNASNDVPFDVFVSPVLSEETNQVTWFWMGQGYRCTTYTLTNMPGTACYLVLGTPYSYTGDGLTDAYQYLVTHTDSSMDDQDGAGISNGWQVLLGLNPLVNQVAQPGTRSTFGYDSADRLTGFSGIKPTSSVGLDNEGNVTSVSQ